MAPTFPRVRVGEQKEHEHNYVSSWYHGPDVDPRLRQLERIERWLETASPLQRLRLNLIVVLVQVLLVLGLQSVLPPVPDCPLAEFDFLAEVCASGSDGAPQ